MLTMVILFKISYGLDIKEGVLKMLKKVTGSDIVFLVRTQNTRVRFPEDIIKMEVKY